MAASMEEPKVITPFIPSLTHIASVHVAIQFLNKFDFEALKILLSETPQENSTSPNECSQENNNINCKRAKESMLIIPLSLRWIVMKAIKNMRCAVLDLLEEPHYTFLRYENYEFSASDVCWRFDGSINTIKTAEKLALNTNIRFHLRFEIACWYCLGDIMRSLWAEAEASGEIEAYYRFPYGGYSWDIHFWIRWIYDSRHTPWILAVRQELRHRLLSGIPVQWLCTMFPLLGLEERQKLLGHLRGSTRSEVLQCLYSLTKAEEEQVLSADSTSVLCTYLDVWPLRSLFLETAAKVVNYIDSTGFIFLLSKIYENEKRMEELDYFEILEGFWNMFPESYRQIARSDFGFDWIDQELNEFKIKRKQ